MKITGIETFACGAGWKNWPATIYQFVRFSPNKPLFEAFPSLIIEYSRFGGNFLSTTISLDEKQSSLSSELKSNFGRGKKCLRFDTRSCNVEQIYLHGRPGGCDECIVELAY